MTQLQYSQLKGDSEHWTFITSRYITNSEHHMGGTAFKSGKLDNLKRLWGITMIGSQFLRFVLLYHSSLQTNQRIHPVLYKELSWDSGMSIFNQTHLAQMAWTGSWHQSFSKAASACRLKRASGTVHPLHPGSTTKKNVRISSSNSYSSRNIPQYWFGMAEGKGP